MTTQLPYSRGLHDLGDGCHAWLEPPGSWGFANSGVVTGDSDVLVVDTQNDLPMAAALRAAVDEVAAGRPVTAVVNTHSDGDHWNGNLLYEGARIIASRATADEMADMWLDPARLSEMAGGDSAFGRFLTWRTEAFDYEGWRPVYPTETFSDRTSLSVGDRTVELIEVGPAHTRGDVIVHVPSAGVVYAGDVLFTDSTPIVWAGPLSRCIDACDRIMACEPRLVVPGHGPIVGAAGVADVRRYLESILEYATAQFRAGRSPAEAYAGLELGEFAAWPHASRAYPNIYAVYRELDPDAYPIAPQVSLDTVLADDDGDWTTAHPCHGRNCRGSE
jgi:glyoxylase-like metal-dependent hydrolase (beta-lactamase superfamily II)